MKDVYAKAAVFSLAKKKSAARVDPPKSHRLGMSCREDFKTSDSGIASADVSVSVSNADPSQAMRGDQR
jgi:hypothetical protein